MAAGIVDPKELERLSDFLYRRQHKASTVSLLKAIKEEHNLKRGQVTTSKSATYEELAEALNESLRNEWLTRERLVKLLDAAELAGRQHVLVYQVPEDQLEELAEALRSPKKKRTTTKLEDFWNVPSRFFSQLLIDDGRTTAVKIVVPRKYHSIRHLDDTDSIDIPNGDGDIVDVIAKIAHRERAAVVVSLLHEAKLLQVRVPPRESGSGSTPRSVYDLAKAATSKAFDASGPFQRLKVFPITDTFNRLQANRDDFVYESDEPQNEKVHARIKVKRGDGTEDLRDMKEWVYAEGYSRISLGGVWRIGEELVKARLHLDEFQINQHTKQSVARVFIPSHCTDADINHVIVRLQSHLV